MSDVPGISCRELVELVTEYLEDALPAGERERFETHLGLCDGCRYYVEQVRITAGIARNTAELEARPDVDSLLQAFRDYRRG